MVITAAEAGYRHPDYREGQSARETELQLLEIIAARVVDREVAQEEADARR